MRRLRRFLAGFFITLGLVAAAGATYQTVADRRDLARVPPPGRMVDVGGHRLHVWCKGTGRPAVLMDAGLGATSFDWEPIHDAVASFARACAYDRAGQGYSDEASTPRTSLHIAAEMRELLSRLGIVDRTVLVGASFGGINVRLFASQYENQTAGLVLVDAPHEDDSGNGEIPWFAVAIPVAGSLGILRATGIMGGNPETQPQAVRGFLRATSHRASRARSLYSEGSRLRESAAQVREHRRPLSVPIVVLSRGRNQNPQSLSFQKAQAALSPRGCQMTVEGSGNVIHRNNPGIVTEAIRATIEAARRRDGAPCDLMKTVYH